ncbi:cystathionine beta-lyase [Pueribacillus theae]|uniref:cysteine-S-conjugate beta-lyase n=1 Tax=Pueribacillus theae TaxID=2171751 RepID=A0A2U1JRB9_9BACI|nr:MalY/PatB family protein [Pueribacillus theae]PWA07701.1 cystathionine beta-lyase [Pueribacillus theae]
MAYHFDKVIDRHNTNSLKWDALKERFGDADLLPMWVADMDFPAPGEVIEALKKVADHGIFGYTIRPDSFYQSLINWLERRHHWKVEKEWINICPGVVPALSLIVQAFTKPGDQIVIQSPVYHPFFSVAQQKGRELVDNTLLFDGKRYEIDFEDLEKKLSDERCKMLLFCSPHNPVGRVWTKDELTKVGNLCLKHNVLMLSDEIHFDLIFKGHKHTPFASISKEFADISITCVAPSKTFNLAGLQSSAIIIPNKKLNETYQKSLDIEDGNMSNSFAIAAFEAAYNNGEQWLEELLTYLEKNLDFVNKFFKEEIPNASVVQPEGTYLVWIDCRKLGLSAKELERLLLKEAKVALNQGYIFGKSGEGFIRLNIACPKSILEEGLNRIKATVNKHISK